MRPPAPWRVLDVEIGVDALDAADAPTFAILRRRGAVVGFSQILPCDLPLNRAETARRAAGDASRTLIRLAQIGDGEVRRFEENAPRDPLPPEAAADLLGAVDAAVDARRARPPAADAVIAVCTRRRPDELAGCLAACRAAQGPAREIVVIDNGPDDATRAVAEAAGARWVPATPAGLNRARNAALAATDAAVVIFVDDDVRPEPGFVEALLARFDAPDVGVVCGLALPEALETEAQIAFQFDLGFGGMRCLPLTFDRAFLEGCAFSPPVWELGAGAVMAVRRAAAAAVGGFDERVGPGGAGGGGDDSEFWRRALEGGWRLRYEPLAVVRHRHRREWAALEAQAFGYAKGHVAALFASWGRHRRRADLVRVFVTLPLVHLGALAAQPGLMLKGRGDPLVGRAIRGWLAGLGTFRLMRPPR